MRMRQLKRGGADHVGAAVLGDVGLGYFARLSLPDHRLDELGLSAAYDDASGRITVSVCGASVSASLFDLMVALELPPGPVGLLAGVDAAVFSSAEAIGAVRGFVCDRVLLGCGENGVAASVEVAAALRLVEEGKAYEVDWAELVWAVVKGEVVAGTPWRCAPYLLRLMERQRPELFAEDDGMLPLRKRLKGDVLQQCQWPGGMLLDSKYLELEKEEDTSLVYGGSQNIGDLEDMPIFGEDKKVADPMNSIVGVGLSFPLIRNGPLGTASYFPQLQEVGSNSNYQTISPFEALTQQIRVHVPSMESRYLDLEKTCRDTRGEVEHIKKMVLEKDRIIEATMSGMVKELAARSAVLGASEAEMNLMCRNIQRYGMLLKKSLTKFQEYRNRIKRGEGADLYLEVLGIAGWQNHLRQTHSDQCQMISRIHKTLDSKSLEVAKKITEFEMSIASINHEVQRLKDSRSIPDLNNGVEDDGESEASMCKTEGASWTGEGDRVSNTKQGAKQLAEFIANSDQRNVTGESVDLNGAPSGMKH